MICEEDLEDQRVRSSNFCLKTSLIALIKKHGEPDSEGTVSIEIESLRLKVAEQFSTHLFKDSDTPQERIKKVTLRIDKIMTRNPKIFEKQPKSYSAIKCESAPASKTTTNSVKHVKS